MSEIQIVEGEFFEDARGRINTKKVVLLLEG